MDIKRQYQLQPQLQAFKKFEVQEDVQLAAAKIEKTEAAHEYTIDEILDSVENGDVSILRELNISYTEIDDGSGYKKISFKFNGVRYTVNIISKLSEDSNNIDNEGTNDLDVDNNKVGEKTLEGLKAQREECLNKLDDVEQQISSLNFPTPPYPNDYTLQDGSLDEQAYNEAMNNYNYELAVYEQKIQELNRIAIETSHQLQVLDSEIAELELKQRTDKLQEDIDALKDSPNANPDLINALEKQLEFVKATGTNTSFAKTMLLNQQADVRLALFNLVVPTPPSTNDFIRSDGTVDEEAYSEALNKYELDSYNYEQNKQGLETTLALINQELRNLELEGETKSADIDKLEKNINAAKKIQQMLDNTKDNEDNKAIIAELKNKLADLAKNVNEQTAILEQLSALQEEMKNQELPTPPKTSDFMKMVYSFTIGTDKLTIKELRQLGDETYIAFLTNGRALQCKPVFDENGNITDLKIIQVNGELTVSVLAESVVDDEAYSKAFKKYETEMHQYDRKMNGINRQVATLSNSLSNLEQQADWLNFSSCTSVLENKIYDYMKNGNYAEAHILENKLRDLRKEFSDVQIKKRNLLNREKVLQNRLNSLVPPTPPYTNDYLNSDGTVNESAYKRAFERYEKQNAQFDRITARIRQKLDDIHNTLSQLNERTIELQAEIEELAQ